MRRALSNFSIFFMFAICLVLVWPNAAQTAHSVTLTWTVSPTTGARYNAYRSLTSGGPYTLLNATPFSSPTYTDTTGIGGTKYFYVVTAVCSNSGCPAGISGESSFSNEVSVTFLGAPPAPAGLAGVAN